MASQMESDRSVRVPANSKRPDSVLTEKVRWSFRQRFRKQLQLLLDEFFDAVDDYFFTLGQSGELCSKANCLQVMRLLRTRQAELETDLLDTAIATVRRSYRAEVVGLNDISGEAEFPDPDASGGVMDGVEVDLALHTAQRRCLKQHQLIMQRLATLQKGESGRAAVLLVEPEVILQSVDAGFCALQRQLTMPLELRLLFIKLFERHVMLKLERVFQDAISILRNLDDPEFIARLYSSSSAFHRASKRDVAEVGHDASAKNEMQAEKTVLYSAAESLPPQRKSLQSTGSVREAVDRLIAGCIENKTLPEFLACFLRKQWREILFLTGLQHGLASLEWNEVRDEIELLLTVADQGLSLEESEQLRIRRHLKAGLDSIEWPQHKQHAFFESFQQYFASDDSAAHGLTNSTRALDSSISPCGEQLLDAEDLEEIAKLLGDGRAQNDRQLQDCLAEVDELPDQCSVDFMLDGAYAQCLLCRKQDPALQYLISKRGANVSITRSRLGVALALQSGELRLGQHSKHDDLTAQTVFLSTSNTRH